MKYTAPCSVRAETDGTDQPSPGSASVPPAGGKNSWQTFPLARPVQKIAARESLPWPAAPAILRSGIGIDREPDCAWPALPTPTLLPSKVHPDYAPPTRVRC